MIHPRPRRRALLTLGATAAGLLPASSLLAQPAVAPSLDVPFVPTPQEVVERMLSIAKVGKNDVLFDLGCGDGRIVVTAAKEHGARGTGSYPAADFYRPAWDAHRGHAAGAGVSVQPHRA